MKSYKKQIFTLLLLLPLLTELLVGMPITFVLSPIFYSFLATLGYGFPVLVIREIVVRKHFGVFSIFLFGLIYGLYNEAFVAKTILNSVVSPVNTFANYGIFENIRIPWMITISVWHALHAVVYPIVFVHYLYPQESSEPWLSNKVMKILGLISISFAVLSFFTSAVDKPAGTIFQFLFFVALSIFIYIIAKHFSHILKINNQQPKENLKFLFPLKGLYVYLTLFTLPLIFSKVKLSVSIFLFYYLLVFVIMYLKFRNKNEISLQKLVLIGLSGCVCVALFAVLITLPFGLLLQGLTNMILVGLFLYIISSVRKIKGRVNF